MFKIKLSLLLIAILLLSMDFSLSYSAFAQTVDSASGTEGTKFTSRFNGGGRFSRASNPECGVFKTGAALAGIAIAIGVAWTAIILIVSSVGLFTAFVIIGVIAAIVGVWKAIGGLVVCQHSFVKHPVIRGSDGKKKDFSLQSGKEDHEECTNKIYKTEEEYFQCFSQSEENGKKIEKDVLGVDTTDNDKDYWWPKNAVQYSDYIEVCHRNPLTFGSILNPLEDFEIREKELNYITTGVWPHLDGALKCEVLKAGESKTIHGSTFKAVKRAGKLCVELAKISWIGIEMNPWPQGVNIGCTDLPSEPSAPMCEKSVMKFKNKNGQGGIKEIRLSDYKDRDYKALIMEKEKSGEIFVEYDNKECFSSYMSSACYDQAGSKALSPIPITSMLVQCIKESLDNLIKGC
nr:hypothetical protein [Wolbachia endosymbiont of Chironomus riparius]